VAALNDAARAADPRPLAYVYDRRVTLDDTLLNRRLKACARHVTRRGWRFGGWWLDVGDDALAVDHRPAFGKLLGSMQEAGPAAPRVCLVHDWGRLSHAPETCDALIARVIALGAWVETCAGDNRPSRDQVAQVGTGVDRPAGS
jgi:hypothetical protein